MKASVLRGRRSFRASARGARGASIVELALVLPLLLMIALGVFEFGRIISLELRLASAAREIGRMVVRNDVIAPDPAKDYGENKSEMQGALNSNVFNTNTIGQMVNPSEIETKGKVIISVLRRVTADGTVIRTKNTSSNNEDEDYILLEYQFFYPASAVSKYPEWTSAFGITPGPGPNDKGDNVTERDPKLIPVKALRLGERTVGVELFHGVDTILPVERFIPGADIGKLYERAIF